MQKSQAPFLLSEFRFSEWPDAVRYAKQVGHRLPEFERHLSSRPADSYSVRNAHFVFEYVRDVAGEPISAIEHHIMACPKVAQDYLRYKRDSDPKNDEGGGMLNSLFRRLRSPQIKAAVHTKETTPQPIDRDTVSPKMTANERTQEFLLFATQALETGRRKSIGTTFINSRSGARHAGELMLHENELVLKSGMEWFVQLSGNPGQLQSIGHWPRDAAYETIRNAAAIKAAVTQLSKMDEGASIPATFSEPQSPIKEGGRLSLVKGKLVLSFGDQDKRYRYETEYPFKVDRLDSPCGQREFLRIITEKAEALEARTKNILDLITAKPEGIKDSWGYHYKLSEDGNSVVRTVRRGKAEVFTREQFNEMETDRLAANQERSSSRGMSMGR